MSIDLGNEPVGREPTEEEKTAMRATIRAAGIDPATGKLPPELFPPFFVTGGTGISQLIGADILSGG